MQQEFEDDLIRRSMIQGRRVLPSSDFEEQMMLKIRAESAYQREVANKIKASLYFFMAGIALGFGLALYALLAHSATEYSSKTICIVFLFVVCVVATMNIDNYRRLLSKYTS